MCTGGDDGTLTIPRLMSVIKIDGHIRCEFLARAIYRILDFSVKPFCSAFPDSDVMCSFRFDVSLCSFPVAVTMTIKRMVQLVRIA